MRGLFHRYRYANPNNPKYLHEYRRYKGVNLMLAKKARCDYIGMDLCHMDNGNMLSLSEIYHAKTLALNMLIRTVDMWTLPDYSSTERFSTTERPISLYRNY